MAILFQIEVSLAVFETAEKDAVFRGILSVLTEELEIMERAIDRVTNSWQPENQPIFDGSINKESEDLVAILETVSTPFVFVDGGTSKRYAVMDRRYRPRTRNRVLGSRGRRGGVAFVHKKGTKQGELWASTHKIEPREFFKEIVKRRQSKFVRKMDKELEKRVAALFRSRSRRSVTFRI